MVSMRCRLMRSRRVCPLPKFRRPLLVSSSPEPLTLHNNRTCFYGDGSLVSPSSCLLPPVPGTTVRVRFVLREQCTFGHSFHLVGNDPALGLWEPANAVALDWSEGHDWTVEKVRLGLCTMFGDLASFA
jgi:hypothetical protein